MKFAEVADVYEKYKDLRKEDVRALQEWAKKQPHLPMITELQFMVFLHSCYYSIELAKTTIDNFFTFRTHCPEFFANRNPTKVPCKTALDKILFIDLPKTTKEGYKVIFCKLMNVDVADYTFAEHMKLFDMCIMQWLHEEGPAAGLIILVDMSGYTFGHLMKMNVLAMKKTLMYLQEALPVRLKGIHHINTGSIMDSLTKIMKPFLKKELTDTMFYYGDHFDKAYSHVPKECFPEDYGGSADSFAVLHANMKKRFNENASYFEDEEKRISDESKRVGKPRSVDDIFGVEGSFKKLDID